MRIFNPCQQWDDDGGAVSPGPDLDILPTPNAHPPIPVSDYDHRLSMGKPVRVHKPGHEDHGLRGLLAAVLYKADGSVDYLVQTDAGSKVELAVARPGDCQVIER